MIQPPEIRHRVLESGEDLQVIEIGVPSQHMTTGDYNMELPTSEYRPDREFNGQRFCHYKKSSAVWHPWKLDGFEFCDTGVTTATKGVANVIIARPKANSCLSKNRSRHSFDIHFTFLLKGRMAVFVEGEERVGLNEGDAYALPSNVGYQYSDCSKDLEILEVSLPNL